MNKVVKSNEADGKAEPSDRPADLREGKDADDRARGRSADPKDDGKPQSDSDAAPPEDGGDDQGRDDGKTDKPRHDVIDVGTRPGSRGKQGDHAKDGDKGGGDGTREREKPDDDRGDRKAEADDGKADGEKEESDEPPPKAPPKIVFIVAGLILLLCLAWGAWSHWHNYSESKQTTDQTVNRVVDVRTTAAEVQDGPMKLTLPGQTDAFDVANLYPRATGYVKERLVDIGARVKQGDLLLHIAAPDLDNQLAQALAQKGQTEAALTQAQAQVTQADANLNLAKVTYARTDQLTQQGFQSLQNRDNQEANVRTQQANLEAAKAGVSVAEANVKAQQATVDRLKALVAFEDVRAPFDGVITNRNVDVGDLLNADSSTGQALFTIMRDDTIRVTVRVPQNAATGILNGLQATVHVPQMPDHPFTGRVERTSEALLYSSRSLTAEVDVPNPDGLMRSGLYVTVDFQLPREHPNVSVPAEALIYNQDGMQVATVQDGTAKLHEATIYRDHGTWIELTDGLDGGERVILSPPATLRDGAKVKETREEDEKAKAAQEAKDKQSSGQGDKGQAQDAASKGDGAKDDGKSAGQKQQGDGQAKPDDAAK